MTYTVGACNDHSITNIIIKKHPSCSSIDKDIQTHFSYFQICVSLKTKLKVTTQSNTLFCNWSVFSSIKWHKLTSYTESRYFALNTFINWTAKYFILQRSQNVNTFSKGNSNLVNTYCLLVLSVSLQTTTEQTTSNIYSKCTPPLPGSESVHFTK